MALRGDPAFAVERLVTVLVIACPHAFGLAVPLVIAISTTLGARSGLLVRDRRGLEEARNLTAIVFDKTGTLTRGEFGVVGITTTGGRERAGRATAGRRGRAGFRAHHRPGHRAVGQGARDRAAAGDGLPGHSRRRSKCTRGWAVAGHGWAGAAEGALGRCSGSAPDRHGPGGGRGQAAIFLTEDFGAGSGVEALAVFIVADVVRPESKAAVQELHDQRIKVVMLTGDARPVAEAVAAELGIDTVFAEVLPQEKVGKIQELQRAGERVGMVGDGVNDAPALVSADVGVAIGAGTDVAVEAGDIVLVRSDPRDVPRIVRLSRASYRKMVQNLWWAAGYNVIAIPLAAGVLARQGILLSPAVGAVLMSLSTVIVAVNAQLLRRSAI